MYIFICTRVQHKASIHSSTLKLKQNKCTHKCSKKGNTPRKWWFKSNQSKESMYLPLFALLVTHKEKHQSRMLVNLKKTEFAPAHVLARSSSHTFHPEPTVAGGEVQSKNYTGWNANSYIHNMILVFLFIL